MVWMTVLKLVPWGEVVKNAPQVAEGAKKLWDTVGRGSVAPPEPRPAAARDVSVGTSTDQRLAQRLAGSEAAVAQLQQQMQAASKLINALADQNAELVARVEAYRARLLWVAGSVALAGVMALVALVAVSVGAAG